MNIRNYGTNGRDRAIILWNLLIDNEQLTRKQILRQTGWSMSQFAYAKTLLRQDIRDHNINKVLVCDPLNGNGGWTYRLVSGKELVDHETTKWPINRYHDAESRLVTIKSAIDTAVKTLPQRSVELQTAKIRQHHLAEAEREVNELLASIA